MEREQARQNNILATAVEGLISGIGGVLDKDALKSVQSWIKKLRDA